MLSSISNSNDRIPDCNYSHMWLISLCLFFAVVAFVDYSYRSKGYVPTINDTPQLWSYWRSRVYTENGRKKIVLIGASRSQLGIEPRTLAEEFPNCDIIHLAIDGKYCYATLADLANDKDFDGIVICSTTPQFLRASELDDQKEYVESYRRAKMSFNELVNLVSSCKLQEEFCVMSSYNTPKIIVERLIKGGEFKMPSVETRFDRYRPAYYLARNTVQQLERNRANRLKSTVLGLQDIMPVDEFIDSTDKYIVPLSERMASKDGAVIYLHMPQSGKHWEVCERAYPKEKYWDEFAKRCGAPSIHFIDYPELSEFECPDGSHLDCKDARHFTKNLADVMKRIGCFPKQAIGTVPGKTWR